MVVMGLIIAAVMSPALRCMRCRRNESICKKVGEGGWGGVDVGDVLTGRSAIRPARSRQSQIRVKIHMTWRISSGGRVTS